MKSIAKAIWCAIVALGAMVIALELINGTADWLTMLSTGFIMALLGASQAVICIRHTIDAISGWSDRRAEKK